MRTLRISSGAKTESQIGFSRAIRKGNFIFVSGTAPIAEGGACAFPGDAYQQSIFCFQKIQKAIEGLGGKIEDVVRTRMYLKNASDWKEVGRAHKEFFADILPASTMLEISTLLNEEWLVEMEANCVLEGQ